MRQATNLGTPWLLTAFVSVAALLLLYASTRAHLSERSLSREEMVSSFGGNDVNTVYCCTFNSDCNPGQYNQSCASLPQGFCDGLTVTSWTGNNKLNCQQDSQAQETCLCNINNTEVTCANCYKCSSYVDDNGQWYCYQSGTCSGGYNTLSCNDCCTPA